MSLYTPVGRFVMCIQTYSVKMDLGVACAFFFGHSDPVTLVIV
jgi:hypothetical protein